MKWLHLDCNCSCMWHITTWFHTQSGPVAFTIAYMIKKTCLMMWPNSPKKSFFKKNF
jgi:hypothetical protein